MGDLVPEIGPGRQGGEAFQVRFRVLNLHTVAGSGPRNLWPAWGRAGQRLRGPLPAIVWGI